MRSRRREALRDELAQLADELVVDLVVARPSSLTNRPSCRSRDRAGGHGLRRRARPRSRARARGSSPAAAGAANGPDARSTIGPPSASRPSGSRSMLAVRRAAARSSWRRGDGLRSVSAGAPARVVGVAAGAQRDGARARRRRGRSRARRVDRLTIRRRPCNGNCSGGRSRNLASPSCAGPQLRALALALVLALAPHRLGLAAADAPRRRQRVRARGSLPARADRRRRSRRRAAARRRRRPRRARPPPRRARSGATVRGELARLLAGGRDRQAERTTRAARPTTARVKAAAQAARRAAGGARRDARATSSEIAARGDLNVSRLPGAVRDRRAQPPVVVDAGRC